MNRTNIIVRNKTGLHARPATEVVNLARRFDCSVTAYKDGKEANLKSLIGLLSLGVSGGDEITLEADGVDEYNAISELRILIEALRDK